MVHAASAWGRLFKCSCHCQPATSRIFTISDIFGESGGDCKHHANPWASLARVRRGSHPSHPTVMWAAFFNPQSAIYNLRWRNGRDCLHFVAAMPECASRCFPEVATSDRRVRTRCFAGVLIPPIRLSCGQLSLIPNPQSTIFVGGTGGIRTLGNLLSYAPLARECFRPLSHRS